MRSSKLIRQLSCLDKEEVSEFQKFVKREKGKESLIFFFLKEVLDYWPNLDHPNIEKEFFLNRIKRKHSADFLEKNFNALVNRLTSLLKEFILQLEFNRNEAYQQYLLAKFFRRKKNRKDEVKAFDELEKLIPTAPVDEQTKHFYRFNMKYDQYYDPLETKHDAEINSQLFNLSERLESFYFIPRARIFMEMMARNTFANSNFSFPNLDQFLGRLDYLRADVPILDAYYHAILLYQKVDDDLYEQTLEKITSWKEIMTISEIMGIFSALGNYASERRKRDLSRDWNRETLRQHLYFEQEGIFEEMEVFEIDHFNNMIALCGYLNEVEKGFQLLEKYEHKIGEEHKEDALMFSDAFLSFFSYYYHGEEKSGLSIDDVIQKLTLLRFRDNSYTERIKYLLCMGNYLKKDDEGLKRELRNLGVFMDRQRENFSELVLRRSENFIAAMKELLDFRNNYLVRTIEELKDFKLRVQNEPLITEKSRIVNEVDKIIEMK